MKRDLLPILFGVGPTTAWTGFCAHIEALDNRLSAMFRALGGLDEVLEDLEGPRGHFCHFRTSLIFTAFAGH